MHNTLADNGGLAGFTGIDKPDRLNFRFALLLGTVDPGLQFTARVGDPHFILESAVDTFAELPALFAIHHYPVHGTTLGAHRTGDKSFRHIHQESPLNHYQ